MTHSLPVRGCWRHATAALALVAAVLPAQATELLANGDFNRGLAHWFYSSDKHHMPWHAKNLAVHLYFEQGLLGSAQLASKTGEDPGPHRAPGNVG